MTPKEVKKYFKSLYRFHKETGMSCSSLGNWLSWGYIPYLSQMKIQRLTRGVLQAEWIEEKE